MNQLYYSPGACSMAIHVILNELALPFELKKIDISSGEGQSPEFLKLNPRGSVPVLVLDGQVIREGGAIIIHLMDEFKSNLMPRSGKLRATALEWLMFANATLHPAYGRAFFLIKNASEPAKEELLKLTIAQINKLWAEVDAVLGNNNRFVCGKDLSAADILLAVIANWGSYLPYPVTIGPNVKRMLREVTARPSYLKALKSEQVEYKAVA